MKKVVTGSIIRKAEHRVGPRNNFCFWIDTSPLTFVVDSESSDIFKAIMAREGDIVAITFEPHTEEMMDNNVMGRISSFILTR